MIAKRSSASVLTVLVLWLATACSAERTLIGSWDPPSQHGPDAALPTDASTAADSGSRSHDASDDEDAGNLRDAAIAHAGYLEAEDGVLTPEFRIGDDPSASHGQYIAPPDGTALDAMPGPARARYDLIIDSAGTYVIWGRIYAPGASNNRFWFQVDDGTWYKWRISTGEIWYWDAFHDDTAYGQPLKFSLTAGKHRITLANCVEGVRLDRLYFTSRGDKPPGNATKCSPPNSIEVGGMCLLSCGSQGGDDCGTVACQGFPTVNAYDCAVCCNKRP